MFVSVNNDQTVVKCQYHEKELVKAIGDYKFNKINSTWIFPLRKLIDIIDNLHIEYSDETKIIYDHLREERQKYHEKINLANKIKSDICAVDSLDGIDLSMCYQHQKKAIILAAMFGSYALFLEPGLGKSLIAIKLIEYWKVPAMIVAPLSTLESVWVNEIKKWSKLNAVILWHNLKEFDNGYDIYIINYAHLKMLAREGRIEDKIKCLIIDESSVMKSPRANITKTILRYSNKIPHRIVMSGTPSPNSLLEFFGQMTFVNPEVLGTDNYFRFRNTYFFSTGYGGYSYLPMKGAKEAIIENISKQALSCRKEDALDLPEQVFETRYVYMDETQSKAYEMMKKENILEFKDSITLAPNELAKISKLREITSGFIINVEGIPVKISNTKIEALKELLEEIPQDRQVIIWVQYHFECFELKKELGDDAVILAGIIPQKEKEKNIELFQKGEKRFLIAHPKSGGHGLNLQNSSYSVWYSLSYSYEEYEQACNRNHRIGQHNKVTYFHLLAKDTIDEIIYKVVNKKANLVEEYLTMLKGA